MKVVHASDWHWNFQKLPEADLYVFTGDMMDNYPIVNRYRDPWDIMGGPNWHISPENERQRQMSAAMHFHDDDGGMREYLGSKDAPVLCVRGNHDYIDLKHLFKGCNLVHEFVDNELVEVLGLRVSGHRGIPWIYGTWNDEVQRPDLMDRVRKIPDDIDLLLTHYPAEGFLDSEGKRSFGLGGMSGHIFNKLRVGGVHCFGHIHGSGGLVKRVDDIRFSNAAETFNEIEL